MKIIKESNEDDEEGTSIINYIYEIEVPVSIQGVDLNIKKEYINDEQYRKLLNTYENYINLNLDIEDINYQQLLNNDIEIYGSIRIYNDVLTISNVSIPKDLEESEVKVIFGNYLTDVYISSYENVTIELNPEEYNDFYSEEISNGEIEPKDENDKNEKLSIEMELQLELDKIKIIKNN